WLRTLARPLHQLEPCPRDWRRRRSDPPTRFPLEAAMPTARTLARSAPAAGLLVALAAVLTRADEPASPPAAVLPDDVAFGNEANNLDADRPAANDYSWRAFVALNWPALPGVRGKPDPAKRLGGPAEHVVWGSWEAADELYTADAETNPPSDWDS